MSPVETIRETLKAAELEFDEPRENAFFVKLPGQHKLATMTWLIVGDHSLHVEAFFCRRPDENHADFYRFLLEKNGRMYGWRSRWTTSATSTSSGSSRWRPSPGRDRPHPRLCPHLLRRQLRQGLERGFKSSIQREWDWRVKRGESLANLQAFASFADPANRE